MARTGTNLVQLGPAGNRLVGVSARLFATADRDERARKGTVVELRFSGSVFQWRGPAPFYYVAVPDDDCTVIRDLASALSYGWGCIPVTVKVGDTSFGTSLFPKDGGYVVPLKAAVRRAEEIDDGDAITIVLGLGEP